jgi:esterase/lipase superfamily enzyme
VLVLLVLVAVAALAVGVLLQGTMGSPDVGPRPQGHPPIARGPKEARSKEGDAADTRTVYYVTDRARFRPDFGWYARRFVGFGVALVGLAAAFLATRRAERRWLRRSVRIVAVLGAVALLMHGAFHAVHMAQLSARLDVLHGGERRPADAASGLPYELGTAEVSFPPTHRRGELERPSPWTGDFFEDPDRHMVVFDVTPMEEAPFYAAVRATVEASLESDAFVFVHGYNVTFEDAVLRAAQIAYDLGFQGAPILFSWPSQGTYAGYPVDETNVRWATPHLTRFLKDLRERSGAKRIHLIAHSMGNRALLEALERLRAQGPSPTPFNQVVLAAPDIDADTFRDDIAPRILSASSRVTLYASSKDVALSASKAFHGYARAGDSGDGAVVVAGMDTIDVSSVSSTHSYVGDNGWVLDDLGLVLLTEEPIRSRPGLRFLEPLRHWILETLGP